MKVNLKVAKELNECGKIKLKDNYDGRYVIELEEGFSIVFQEFYKFEPYVNYCNECLDDLEYIDTGIKLKVIMKLVKLGLFE